MPQLLRTLATMVIVIATMAFATTSAFAHPSTAARDALSEVEGQGGGATSSLSGTVTDTSGALIPGATVAIKNNATASEFQAVSNENGIFTIPAIDPGAYTVTVTLMGFRTVTLKDVRVNAAVPATVKVTLEVGGLEETVVVEGGHGDHPDAVGGRHLDD